MTTDAPTALLALGALASVVVAAFLLRALPRASFFAWTLVLFFVPVWVGANAGVFWSAITALTVLLLAAHWTRVPLHPADAWMAVFTALLIGLFLLRGVTYPSMLTAVLEWVIPYAWGRIACSRLSTMWITRAIALAATVAAGLALLEFATSFNPFVLIPGPDPLYSAWDDLQPRGGFLRAEGAFGHSIALGAALAMSSAFVIAARWRLIPTIVSIAVIVSATVVTFSRAGLITLLITLVLSICLLPGVSARLRATVVAAGAVGAVLIFPLVDGVLGAAGEEAAGSAGYRTDLLVLIRQVRPFGSSGDWTSLVTGDYYLGHFARSIDNALMLMLLRYGTIPTLLLLATIVCVVLLVVRQVGRNPAALAVVGQLPSLVVVALITQYGTFLWFCVGLAIGWGPVHRAAADAVESRTRTEADHDMERTRIHHG